MPIINFPFVEIKYAVGVGIYVTAVCDDDYGAAAFLEFDQMRDYFSRIFRIEIACWLIRQDNPWVFEHCARDGCALLFTGAELRGPVQHSV